MSSRNLEIQKIEKDWKENPRWKGIRRDYSAADVYRLRWEIEIDNKVEKMGTRLDEISARAPISVRVLLLASLLNATLARILVHQERLSLRKEMARDHLTEPPRAPLHQIAMVRAMRVITSHLIAMFTEEDSLAVDWDDALSRLRSLARDPNWRRKPSLLDRMLGLTGALGRKRNEKGKGQIVEALA